MTFAICRDPACPRPSPARGERLPSVDVVSHVLHFCRVFPDESSGAYRLDLRSISKEWSLAFGQYVELWVVPRGTMMDDAGRPIWMPSERCGNAEFLLFLLHIDGGLTRRIVTSFLYGLHLLSPLPRACVERLLRPGTPITAVRMLVLGKEDDDGRYLPSAAELDFMVEWLPNLTSLSVDMGQLGLADVLRLPPTMQELFLLGMSEELASDDAVKQLADRFPNLSEVLLPWSAAMTDAASSRLAQSPLTAITIEARGQCDVSVLEPIFRMAGLVRLWLRNAGLMRVPDSLGRLNTLQELGLVGNQFTALPEAFGGLRNLQGRKHYNNLTALPEFGDLCNLRELGLGCNKLTALPDSFGGLSNLQKLGLNNNKLTALPDSFSGLSNLVELWLRNNNLAALPDSFGGLKNLQKLELQDNELTALPNSFGRLSNLQELWLQDNKLTALPDSFGGLSKLQWLWLQDNKLTALPDSFGGLSKLQWLSLQDNELTHLPDSFGRLSNLQELGLSKNKLAALPESFGSLGNLQLLRLSNNKLAALPDSFGGLRNLQKLGLSNNKLTALPDSFGGLSNLQWLWLHDNELAAYPDSFGGLSNLQELCLKDNKLAALPHSFGYLSNLQQLRLKTTS